jgi:hypothetical protein
LIARNPGLESGAVNTLLDSVDFEHGQGLLIRGSAPVLNRVDNRNQAGPPISIDLLASPTGVANSASGNAVNGIQVPAGDIAGQVRRGLRGIPYVIESRTVSVGVSPQVDSVLPATVEQGTTVTLNVNGSRLDGLTSAALDQAGLGLTPFSGGSASQLFMQIQVDPLRRAGRPCNPPARAPSRTGLRRRPARWTATGFTVPTARRSHRSPGWYRSSRASASRPRSIRRRRPARALMA